MRIGLCSLSWYTYGGAESYGRVLYDELKRLGHDVHLIFFNKSGRKGKFEKEKDNDILETMTYSYRYKKIKETIKYLNSFDVIHLLVSASPDERKWYKEKGDEGTPDYYKMLSNIETRKIQTIHDPYAFKNYTYLMNLLSFDDSFYDETIFIRKKSMEFYKNEGVNGIFIPHPINCDDADYHFKRKNIAITTSRIVFQKRHKFLVNVAPDVNGEIRIYSYGNNCLYFLKQNENWKYVKYLGTFEEEKKSKIYGEAKVLVDMSRIPNDGSGSQYTYLEALKYGTIPIISSDWGEGEDMKDGENIIICKDHDKLHEDINMVFEDDKLRKRIMENNKKLVEKHDVRKIIKDYIKVYKN